MELAESLPAPDADPATDPAPFIAARTPLTGPAAHAPAALLLRRVEAWVLGHLGTLGHERRVAALACSLFDLTRPLHRLGDDRRHLLRLAALVHDVGRSVEDDGHERHGAKLVLRDRSMGLGGTLRRQLAFCTLHHRGDVPRPGDEPWIDGRGERRAMRAVLALLRAADALDGRSVETPHILLALRGRRLLIDCFLATDCPRARKAYARRKKYRLLEEELGLEVRTHVHGGAAAERVA